MYITGQFHLLKDDPSLEDISYTTRPISSWYHTVTSGKKEKEADICLFVEGTYPYVSGGVASWARDLLESFNDMTFSIVSIGSSGSDIREFKHKFPANVLYYTDVNLYDLPAGSSGKKNNVRQNLDMVVDFIASIDTMQEEDFEKICHTLGILDKFRLNINDLLFPKKHGE